MALTSEVLWNKADVRVPKRRGYYLVSDGERTLMAMWYPLLKIWKFPNYKLRLDILWWAGAPVPQNVLVTPRPYYGPSKQTPKEWTHG